MRRIGENVSMDELRSMIRRLKAKNDMNMIIMVGVGIALAIAAIVFIVLKCKDKCDENCCCYDEDDDYCENDDYYVDIQQYKHDNVATDEDFVQ